MKSEVAPASHKSHSRLRDLTLELEQLDERLRLGGGPDKIERQHQQGKLTARERIELLLDKGSYSQEIGLLVAYDEYKGQAPSAGVVTTLGRVGGREVGFEANYDRRAPGGPRRLRRFCARRRSVCARTSPSFIWWIPPG